MRKGKIRLIGSPPGSGKSAVKAALAEELGSGWLVLEHEQIFTPEQRVKTAELAKVSMASKEFVLGANLPGQLAFQALLRSVADAGINVVGLGPFENVSAAVNGMQLWRKMTTEDFGAYDFSLTYFLVTPQDDQQWSLPGADAIVVDRGGREIGGAAEEVESEIQRRLLSRANKSPYQVALDADKVGVPDYYRRRVAHVLRSSQECCLPLFSYAFDASPRELAQALVEYVTAET